MDAHATAQEKSNTAAHLTVPSKSILCKANKRARALTSTIFTMVFIKKQALTMESVVNHDGDVI